MPEEQMHQEIPDEFFFRCAVETEAAVSPFPELTGILSQMHGNEIMVIAGVGFQSVDIRFQFTQVPDAVTPGVDVVGIHQSVCFQEDLLLDGAKIIIGLFHIASPYEIQWTDHLGQRNPTVGRWNLSVM